MNGRPNCHKAMTNRAFTAIELMMVISIMLILSTLTLTGVNRSLRVAAVNNAVSAIRASTATAQELALNFASGAGVNIPGILIGQHEGRWAVAPVLADPSSSNVTFDDAIMDDDGYPSIFHFSPNVALYDRESMLPNDTMVTWFYAPGSGQLMIAQGSGFSPPSAMVGYTPPPLIQGTTVRVFGAFGGSEDLHVLYPPSESTPGLSLRSRDQRTKRSIIVQPSGAMLIQEFE